MAEPCKCNCGYRCGGPGRCKLGVLECLQQDNDEHFVKDCGHDWTGEAVEGDWFGGSGFSSAACKHCGMLSINHDMRFGP